MHYQSCIIICIVQTMLPFTYIDPYPSNISYSCTYPNLFFNGVIVPSLTTSYGSLFHMHISLCVKEYSSDFY